MNEYTIIQKILDNSLDYSDLVPEQLSNSVVATMIESENPKYFDNFIHDVPTDILTKAFDLVIDNSKYQLKLENIPDFIIDRTNYLVENFELSGDTFGELIVNLLKLKEANGILKKIFKNHKLPIEYLSSKEEFTIFKKDSVHDTFIYNLVQSDLEVFQCIIGTDIWCHIRNRSIEIVLEQADIGKLKYLLENHVIVLEEIDLDYLFKGNFMETRRVPNIISILEYLQSSNLMVKKDNLCNLFRLAELFDS